MGMVAFEIGEYLQAQEYCHKILVIAPAHLVAHTLLGSSLIEEKSYNRAITVFDRALAIDKNFVPAITGKAVALCELGSFNDALRLFEQAIQIDPALPDSWIGKGMVLWQVGQARTGQ